MHRGLAAGLAGRRLDAVLLADAWNADDWTFDALVAHYETLCRYLGMRDRGRVLGYGCGTPGMTRAFAEEMEASGTANRIRAEEGNVGYRYFQPLDDPETVMLIDSWADQAALDAHHASPMMAVIAELRDTYDLHMRAERFVTDEAGVPDHDAAFIRR